MARGGGGGGPCHIAGRPYVDATDAGSVWLLVLIYSFYNNFIICHFVENDLSNYSNIHIHRDKN